MSGTVTVNGPILTPGLEPQAGITLTFEVRTGTDTGAHFGPLGEIVGPAVVVTDEDADFSVDLPVPSELTPAGSVITCTVKQPGLSRTDPMLRNEWFYVLRGDLTAGSYSFGDVAILAAPDSVMPPGYVPVAGPGVAAGGTAGQVLTKTSDTDFDTEWGDPQGGNVTAGKNVVVDNSVVSVPAVPASDVPVDTSTWVSSGAVPNPWDAQAALAEIEGSINGQIVPMLQNTVLPRLEDLGTAASLDVPTEGENASDTQIVRGDDTRLAPGGRFIRDWVRDGLSGLTSTTPTYISSPSGSEPAHVPSIQGDRIRISSTVENTNGNVRELWFLSDDEYTDVDVLVRLVSVGVYPNPDQIGIAVRVRDNGDGTNTMVNVNNNVVGGWGPINAGVWSFNTGGGLTQRTQGHAAVGTRQARIIAYARTGSGPYTDIIATDNDSMFNVGDAVKIDAFDDDYDQTSATVVAKYAGLWVDSPSSASGTKPSAPGGGSVTSVGTSPRLVIPAWLRVRIIGSTLMVKCWIDYGNEPQRWDTIDLSEEPYLAPKGKIALMTNHLNGDAYMEFGSVEVTPLGVL